MDNEKIYIVSGYLYEDGDEFTWIEEIFKNRKQAEACCTYLNIVHSNNPEFYMSEYEVSYCNYIGLLEERKEWILKLEEEEERSRLES